METVDKQSDGGADRDGPGRCMGAVIVVVAVGMALALAEVLIRMGW